MRGAVLAAIFTLSAAFPALAAGPHCTEGYYRNVSGHMVHRPECVGPSVHLQGETAICRDGSHSLSEHRTGTCSHHGGVARYE